MNKIMKLMMMALAIFSANAFAIPITTVGSYDNLLAQSNITSGFEEAWIESVLSINISYTQLNDTVSNGGNWTSVEGGITGDWAFDFGPGNDPAYFLVKLGGGKGAGADNTHYLFENIESLQWAFVNLGVFGDAVLTKDNIGLISHVGLTSIPEPGIAGLFAMGLFGLVVARRRMKL